MNSSTWSQLMRCCIVAIAVLSITNASAADVEPTANVAASVADETNPAATDTSTTAESSPGVVSETEVTPQETSPPSEEPWDYSPYRVRVWITSNGSQATAAKLSKPLTEYFDRSFAAIWRLSITAAPTAVQAIADRDFAAMTYESITASDPVVAVKRDHREAARIRVAADVARFVKSLKSTGDRIAEVNRRGNENGNPTLDGLSPILQRMDGDSVALAESWKNENVEAVLLSRGMAAMLKSPEAKIVRLPIDDLVMEDVQDHDKIFVVHIDCRSMPLRVQVAELDCLMRHFSAVQRAEALNYPSLANVVGQAIVAAFAPIVRIEDAGQKTAVGVTRAAKLIVDEDNPALIKSGEFLQPMVRKDDRNGNPIAIGPLPWAFLHVTKVDGARLDMDLYAGRAGGLQGRQNKRTFRVALRTRPALAQSTIRLHAAGNPNEPLIGYELYEKELDSIDMTPVGRTDWSGRILITKTDDPMRLLYVKNGGAILARLPIVPGLNEVEVADLVGDDQRLRAEAYIRGTQNAIVDLIAIRTLLGARIRSRLEKGQLAEAKDLLDALRDEPTYEVIAGDMAKKVVQIKGRNSGEQRKIDSMFAQTREMLVNNINSKLIRDLEAEVTAATAGGAKPQAKSTDTAP